MPYGWSIGDEESLESDYNFYRISSKIINIRIILKINITATRIIAGYSDATEPWEKEWANPALNNGTYNRNPNVEPDCSPKNILGGQLIKIE